VSVKFWQQPRGRALRLFVGRALRHIPRLVPYDRK
jgi:hypothetical protein